MTAQLDREALLDEFLDIQDDPIILAVPLRRLLAIVACIQLAARDEKYRHHPAIVGAVKFARTVLDGSSFYDSATGVRVKSAPLGPLVRRAMGEGWDGDNPLVPPVDMGLVARQILEIATRAGEVAGGEATTPYQRGARDEAELTLLALERLVAELEKV